MHGETVKFSSLTSLFKQITGHLLLDGEGKFILSHINKLGVPEKSHKAQTPIAQTCFVC